jgi:hypothetical protein
MDGWRRTEAGAEEGAGGRERERETGTGRDGTGKGNEAAVQVLHCNVPPPLPTSFRHGPLTFGPKKATATSTGNNPNSSRKKKQAGGASGDEKLRCWGV